MNVYQEKKLNSKNFLGTILDFEEAARIKGRWNFTNFSSSKENADAIAKRNVVFEMCTSKVWDESQLE